MNSTENTNPENIESEITDKTLNEENENIYSN